MRVVALLTVAMAAIVNAWSDDLVSSLLAGHQFAVVARRQSPTSTTSSSFSSPTSISDVTNTTSTFDMTAWDRATTELCIARLTALDVASNPSGTAICYNVPMLNNQTGRFVADMRLFKISQPTGKFTGSRPQDFRASLEYSGAMVSRVENTTATEKNDGGDDDLRKRLVTVKNISLGKLSAALSLERRASSPQLLETYLFVGQIDQDKITGTETE